jgi:hypothetical protein
MYQDETNFDSGRREVTIGFGVDHMRPIQLLPTGSGQTREITEKVGRLFRARAHVADVALRFDGGRRCAVSHSPVGCGP